MHHLLARLGALALSTAVLGACASDPVTPSTDRAQADSAATAIAAASNLDDEIRQAQFLRVKGDYAGAVRMLSQLMLVTQDDPRVVGEYGKVLVQQGRAPEAVEFLNRAIELQPRDWTFYSALGVAYDQTGDSTKARDAYQRALVLKPGEAAVLNNFALSRMLAGDPDEARKLMNEATAAGSADPKIARNLALIDTMATPAATPLAQPTIATGAPATVAPAPTTLAPTTVTEPPATTQPAASQPPKPLVASKTEDKPNQAVKTVVMQPVPFDPLAGPVSKKAAKASHSPRKLAETHKPRQATAHQATVQTVKSTIPALRLANDRP